MENSSIKSGTTANQVGMLLDHVKESILNGEYLDYIGPTDSQGWAGAGVVFSTVPVHSEPGGFYPDCRTVITPHAHAVGWLLNNLGGIFSAAGLIDHFSKYAFYGQLADVVEQCQANEGVSTASGTLLAIHAKAVSIQNCF